MFDLPMNTVFLRRLDLEIGKSALFVRALLFFGTGSLFPAWIRRHRVVPMGPPGVALANPLGSQPDTFENAPFFNGLYGVMGAGWIESAIGA
jgi:hypothetical protein